MAPILMFVALWLGGSSLIVGAWLHPLIPGGWASILGLIGLGILPLRCLARGFGGKAYPSKLTRIFLLRPFWYAMLFMPVLAIVALVGGLAGAPFSAGGAVGRWALGLAAAGLAIAIVAGYAGSRRLVIKRLEVRMPRLPRSFDGLRIVQISDLHVGPHTPRRYLQRVFDRVQNEASDLIAITGDQVDDFAQDVDLFNSAFAELEAPLGRFVVAGNHDVYAGWPKVHQGLAEAGFTVLVNRAVAVERQGDRLWIAGTGDPAATGGLGLPRSDAAPDVEATLAEVVEGEPVVALAHNPALWPALVKGHVDLTLSGHTHYGQLAVPSRNWSIASPFLDLAMGSHSRGDALLYINPGTNYWGIPFRLGTPPEITVLTLRVGEPSKAGLEVVPSPGDGSQNRHSVEIAR